MSPILFDLHEGIARITLNRPERLNSIDTAMRGELMQVLRDRRVQAARALILTGAGRAFCTGQDLGDRAMAPGAASPISANRSRLSTSRWCWGCEPCRSRSSPR